MSDEYDDEIIYVCTVPEHKALKYQNQVIQERIEELVKWAWQFGKDGCPGRDQHLSSCPIYKAVFKEVFQ